MKCKLCGSTIPDGSLYCNICGRYQLKKPKDEIISPKPWQLPSGKWRVQKRSMGINVIADTPEAAKKEAEYRMRNWLIADERGAHEPKPEILTLEKALENYIKSRESTRAVTTISRYRSIAKFRFQSFMKTDVTDLDTQQMIDGEIEAGKAPKTIKNSWSLVASSLRYAKVQFEVPCLPRVPKAERKWLDYNQIELFLKAIRDSEYELGALLALHSLRRSELYGLRPSDYEEKKQIIHIRGALHKVNGVYIRTELNKNDTSARDVPIIVPRLAPRHHCPWNFPGKKTGAGCHFLFQSIFLTQRLNPSLPSPTLAGRVFTTAPPGNQVIRYPSSFKKFSNWLIIFYLK